MAMTRTTDGFTIAPVETPADLRAVSALFAAYAAALPIDLGYQDFSTELASLPGKYAPPTGALLLARDAAGIPIGCVAMRPLAPAICEMKRLYVSQEGRGLGLGLALAEAIIAAAGRAGYREMRLDTLPSMTEAISLYRRLGFMPIAPYYATPIAGTLFFARSLAE